MNYPFNQLDSKVLSDIYKNVKIESCILNLGKKNVFLKIMFAFQITFEGVDVWEWL